MTDTDDSMTGAHGLAGGARGGNPTRLERDAMGEITVPRDAYWGAQTQRALALAPVAGQPMPRRVIRALGLIKRCAAEVNRDLGRLDPSLAEAIVRAASEVAAGEWADQFPLDWLQTGSGTSTHMNVNEVIANRANELLGAPRGARAPVHPNDHVNTGQSSNDVFPTAIHLAVRGSLAELLTVLDGLAATLTTRSEAFAAVVKPGRTHLQDALPVTLGQEFSGYAQQIVHGARRVRATLPDLEELPLGGTAVGTGVGTHPEFAARVIALLARETGFPYRRAENAFEAIAARDALVALMGALNGIAVSAVKIANDLRLLASGPRTGLHEIRLPALQPGSSIMPGKVNPVVPEIVMQAAAQVMGHHVATTIGGQHGSLELNTMMPLMAHDGLDAIDLLTRSLRLLSEGCVAGIEADREGCAAGAAASLALVTSLVARIGYDRAAQIARRALERQRPIGEIAVEEGVLTEAEARELLDPRHMTG
jgi:fumarate hydratase class II